jgi:hypothetical protein
MRVYCSLNLGRGAAQRKTWLCPRDRTARTEPKTRCPATRLPRTEMPLDNNSEHKAGGGAHWGGRSRRERAPARAAWSTILVRQNGSPVRSTRSRSLLIAALQFGLLWTLICLVKPKKETLPTAERVYWWTPNVKAKRRTLSSSLLVYEELSTEGLPFRNSFDFILTPTPHMLCIGRKLLISRVYKTQHA